MAVRKHKSGHIREMLIADLMGKFDGLGRLRDSFIDLALGKIALSEIAHRLHSVPLVFSTFGKIKSLIEIFFGFVEVAAQDIQLAERVIDAGSMDVIFLE